MAWITRIPAGKIVVVNGAELSFPVEVVLHLHNKAHVLHPDGKEFGEPVRIEPEIDGLAERGA